jgi:hypothetical protein
VVIGLHQNIDGKVGATRFKLTSITLETWSAMSSSKYVQLPRVSVYVIGLIPTRDAMVSSSWKI